MTCRRYRLLLGVYAIDRLDGAEQPELLGHLAGCPPCRAELAELTAVAELLADTVLTLPPAHRRTACPPHPPRTRNGAGRALRTGAADRNPLSAACAASRGRPRSR